MARRGDRKNLAEVGHLNLASGVAATISCPDCSRVGAVIRVTMKPGHTAFAAAGFFYSVPHTLIRQQVEARLTERNLLRQLRGEIRDLASSSTFGFSCVSPAPWLASRAT
ncbi:MAG: hypothetical protein QOJ42_3392 [Acidobacteriaceae bacterium]|nr:hypothetical protein [Acidobacteriaceae bacterium]